MLGSEKHHHAHCRKGDDNYELTGGSVVERIKTYIYFANSCCKGDDSLRAVLLNAAVVISDRYDRHVRLQKLSNIIAIECKSITYLLQSPKSTDSSENTITEAKERLQKLIHGPIKDIGMELIHCIFVLHAKAVTGGFQEYVKARVMLSLMAENRIITYPEVQKEFEYNIIYKQKPLVTKIPQSDYILGLAELTLELMREAINSMPSGDTEECFEASDILRQLYTGYLGMTDVGHLNGKLPVTRANLHKVEHALHALRKRYAAKFPFWMDNECQ